MSASSSSFIQPIVISGPSGGGKSTLLKQLFNEFPYFKFSVSHTTRKPRVGENNGVDYHFVTRDEFMKMVAANEFLEHAEFSGNCYGTSKHSVNEIEKTGLVCILDVEVNGVKNIKKSGLSAKYIFIRPPSMEILKTRLENRGTETPESLQKRLNTVKEALDYADAGNYDHDIINDKLDTAYSQLKDALKNILDQKKTT